MDAPRMIVNDLVLKQMKKYPMCLFTEIASHSVT